MPDEIYNLAAQSHVKVSFELPEYTAMATGLVRTNTFLSQSSPSTSKQSCLDTLYAYAVILLHIGCPESPRGHQGCRTHEQGRQTLLPVYISPCAQTRWTHRFYYWDLETGFRSVSQRIKVMFPFKSSIFFWFPTGACVPSIFLRDVRKGAWGTTERDHAFPPSISLWRS
jgi:hypothetical protein